MKLAARLAAWRRFLPTYWFDRVAPLTRFGCASEGIAERAEIP